MRRKLTGWLISLAALLGVLALRWALDPLMGSALPLVTLFGAVAIAVWVSGTLPAIGVTVLGYLACDFLFIEPRGSLEVDAANVIGLIAYVISCALIIAFGHAARLAQRSSSERNQLLRVTLSSIGDAVITTDNGGRITSLNVVAESLTGWKHSDALGQPLDAVFRILDEQSGQAVENPATRALQEGIVVGVPRQTILISKDGVTRPIDDSAAPIRDEAGAVSGCVLIFRDITERRRWEKDDAARLLDARLLAAIVESSDDAIISKSLGGYIRSWNSGAERLFGYPAAHAVGRHISLIIPPERITEEDEIIASLKAGQRVEHFETERLRSDGTVVKVSLTISPVRDDAGNVVGASKIARDITDRRRAEAEKEKFIMLVENSRDFIGICDPDGIPSYINRAGLEMVGLQSMEQARGLHVREYFFAEDQARIVEEFFPSVAEKGHGEIDIRFRNFKTGAERWMAYKVLKLTDARGATTGFATVSQDVTERRRLEESLRTLAVNLSEVDRRKDEFLATLSHELRNPLAPLSYLLQQLKRGGMDPETRSRAVDAMERQLNQLVGLVDDLLDLNRITYNRIELHKSQVELAAVVQQAVQSSRPAADAAGHIVEVINSPEPIYLIADGMRLSQIFGNLLHNSCKYTPPGGRITVTSERQGNEAVVTVADTGKGIPADKLDSIFDMFSQVDRSHERSQGGLGIGLTLVKRLLQLHGGSVKARSAGEGKGSEFIVRLPDVVEYTAVTPEPPTASVPVVTRRILIVDDNRDAADSLAMLLQLEGHQTLTASDGPSAVEAAAQYRPEVILLDIGLPVMNGHEVCRRIRKQAWGSDMLIIALTGWGQEADRRESRDAGFDGHLVKPVDYDALNALLNDAAAAKSAA